MIISSIFVWLFICNSYSKTCTNAGGSCLEASKCDGMGKIYINTDDCMGELKCCYTTQIKCDPGTDGICATKRYCGIKKKQHLFEKCSKWSARYLCCVDPVKCEFTEWSKWSSCSTNIGCQVGERNRTRTIPQHLYKILIGKCGPLIEVETCTNHCNDCEISNWSEWSECCSGKQYRTRTITHPGEGCSLTKCKNCSGIPKKEEKPCPTTNKCNPTATTTISTPKSSPLLPQPSSNNFPTKPTQSMTTKNTNNDVNDNRNDLNSIVLPVGIGVGVCIVIICIIVSTFLVMKFRKKVEFNSVASERAAHSDKASTQYDKAPAVSESDHSRGKYKGLTEENAADHYPTTFADDNLIARENELMY